MRSGARVVASGVAAVAAVALLGACSASGSPGSPGPDAAQVVRSLGAVPVPSDVPAESTPSARPGKPAVLAIGGPVDMRLPDGDHAIVTALGPTQQRYGRAPSTAATITLQVALGARRGARPERIGVDELSSRDETGRAITLHAVGPAAVTVAPGSSARIRVAGVWRNGSAQVTWRHEGHVMAVWTFTIELD